MRLCVRYRRRGRSRKRNASPSVIDHNTLMAKRLIYFHRGKCLIVLRGCIPAIFITRGSSQILLIIRNTFEIDWRSTNIFRGLYSSAESRSNFYLILNPNSRFGLKFDIEVGIKVDVKHDLGSISTSNLGLASNVELSFT